MMWTLERLKDFFADVLWNFDDGKDTMTIKVIKTADELMGAGDF